MAVATVVLPPRGVTRTCRIASAGRRSPRSRRAPADIDFSPSVRVPARALRAPACATVRPRNDSPNRSTAMATFVYEAAKQAPRMTTVHRPIETAVLM